MFWVNKDVVNKTDFIKILSTEESLMLNGTFSEFINDDSGIRENRARYFNNFKPLFETIIQNLINQKGFYVIKGCPSLQSGHSLDTLKNFILEFSSYLGTPLAQNKKKDLIFDVKPQEGVSLSTYDSRGPQFREALAMHTDTGSILIMYCLDSANVGGHTLLSSAEAIYKEISKVNSDAINILLNRDFYVDRRGQELDQSLPYDARPIFSIIKDEIFCQYHSTFITDAQKKFPEIPRLNNEALDALNLFDSVAIREDLIFEINLEPGDIIFINNEKILHGRTAFDSFAPLSTRHFLRLWLNSRYIDQKFPHFLGY